MPRILCHYGDCIFLENQYCQAPTIELDPDVGCTTYSQAADIAIDWDEDEEDLEDWDDLDDEEEEEDESWLEEEEE